MNGFIHLLNNFLNTAVPREIITTASFYLIAAITCAAALMAVISRSIFHCALFLAAALLGIAAVYLFLNAEFIAVIQVLIYVGAIVTLFIFAIMLTYAINDKSIRQTNHQVFISGAITLGILSYLIAVIKQTPWISSAGGQSEKTLTLAEMGKALMTVDALPFEILSLILLAALVGAIALGKTERK